MFVFSGSSMSVIQSSAILSNNSSVRSPKNETKVWRIDKTWTLPLLLRSSKSSRILLQSPPKPAIQLIYWRLAVREDVPKPRLKSSSKCRNKGWLPFKQRKTGSENWNKNSQQARGSSNPLNKPRMLSDRWSMQVFLNNRKTDLSIWIRLERL